MKTRGISSVSPFALVATLSLSGFVLAAAPAEKAAAKPPMDEKAMMEIYMKAATPGPEHAEMAKLAGNWKLDVTSWMSPGAPSEKSASTAKYEPILGGRYMQQTVHGDMGGQPFEGMGIEGFDNVSKEQFGIWMDNMGTGTMISKGHCPMGATTCTMTGTMNDPMTGKSSKVREVVTHKDANSFMFDMYGPDPAGKEFHMMNIVYTRQ